MLETNDNKPVRSSIPQEMPAVRMTIVGGRPPGCGRQLGDIPRGVEVLVKKASVDPWFKALLLSQRAAAAEAIGLLLEPAEVALLNFIPAAQLEAVIAGTKVEPSKVPAFLGRAAAVMLVALGASTASSQVVITEGVRPNPPASQPADVAGIRPPPVAGLRAQPATDEATTQPAKTTQPATQPTTRPEQVPVTYGIRTAPGLGSAVGLEVASLIATIDSCDLAQSLEAQKKLLAKGPRVIQQIKIALFRRKNLKPDTGKTLDAIVDTLARQAAAEAATQPATKPVGPSKEIRAMNGLRADTPLPKVTPPEEPATKPVEPPIQIRAQAGERAYVPPPVARFEVVPEGGAGSGQVPGPVPPQVMPQPASHPTTQPATRPGNIMVERGIRPAPVRPKPGLDLNGPFLPSAIGPRVYPLVISIEKGELQQSLDAQKQLLGMGKDILPQLRLAVESGRRKLKPDTIRALQAIIDTLSLPPAGQPASQPTTKPVERPNQIQERAGARADVPLPLVSPPATEPTSKPSTEPTSLPAGTVQKIQKLVPQLDAEDFKTREEAQKQLVEMGPDIAPILIETIKSGKQSLEANSRLEAALKTIVAKLVAQIRLPDAGQQDQAAKALKAMGPGIVPTLREAVTKGKLDWATTQRLNQVIVALGGQPAYSEDQLRPVRGARAQ